MHDVTQPSLFAANGNGHQELEQEPIGDSTDG